MEDWLIGGREELLIELLKIAICWLLRPPAKKYRCPYFAALKLAFIEQFRSWQSGDGYRGCL